MTQELITKIAIFQKKEIRKVIHKNEWWFSIIDIIDVLTGTERPRKYWNDLKNKLIKEGYSEVSENIGQLKVTATNEWKNRGVKESPEYAILTAEISRATFGMTP